MKRYKILIFEMGIKGRLVVPKPKMIIIIIIIIIIISAQKICGKITKKKIKWRKDNPT